jgi:hypothetical protein
LRKREERGKQSFVYVFLSLALARSVSTLESANSAHPIHPLLAKREREREERREGRIGSHPLI